MTITDIIEYLKTNLDQTDITLHQGADDNLIDQFERALKIKLRDDIRQFYKFSNGFESAEDIFNIIPLEEIMEYKLKEGRFYLAEYMIYSDMWELEINSLDNNDYAIFNINQYSEKIIITNSLAEFLTKFLNSGVFGTGGLYEWGDGLRPKKSDPN
jgi:hypothetical protein